MGLLWTTGDVTEGTDVTEQEWIECPAQRPMLEFLRGKAGTRKLVLLGVACCRRIWHLLTNELSRRKVALMEQRADREMGEAEEWMTVVGGARWVAHGPNAWAFSPENVVAWEQAAGSGTPAAKAADFLGWSEDTPAVVAELTVIAEWENRGKSSPAFREANRRICDLIRDIFNPLTRYSRVPNQSPRSRNKSTRVAGT
jgi:hypothetical protein